MTITAPSSCSPRTACRLLRIRLGRRGRPSARLQPVERTSDAAPAIGLAIDQHVVDKTFEEPQDRARSAIEPNPLPCAAYMGTRTRRHTAPAAHKPPQNREFTDRTLPLSRGTSG